ncbi:PREDICTED: uncharacterized protein LOC109150827 [Ipomoea nil]|uniref:uncharacterized protein LOC109150827 n=1 Tax=Ipomoea nil TaxID=35883 RepID=UPI000901483A|nr:PREDICTED: uncharacterized protein LOC109150827 [Ipomoea nil]
MAVVQGIGAAMVVVGAKRIGNGGGCWLDTFRLRLGFDYTFAGVNDKLWLFWNSDLALTFEYESDKSVSVSCGHATIPFAFWLSFVYAKTRDRLRVPLWAELLSVSNKIPSGVPWSVVGDFNCLLNVDEKKGGLPYPHRKTTDIRECVSTRDLIESYAYGSPNTSWNGRRKDAAIWMRLDRFLYTSEWESIFTTSIQHLSRTTSDHCPLLVTSEELEDKVHALEEVLQQNPNDDRALIDYNESVVLLQRQVSIEEEYWQQKAHVVAVQEGDRNSKFFRSMVKERRRKLYIHKPAGPDGFSGAFYKSCWGIVKGDVVNMVKSYFLGRKFTRSITHTSIVILPKNANPETFADYRPISLCNFSSKIVTKLMVIRLASVLPRLLSPYQSGFVSGRSITDNILLASEMCHGIKLGNQDVVLKLDMTKAYDRVSWFFLVSVMRRMGFSEVWIDLVYRAVSNVWYSVIVNGVKEGFFTSSRGLRQGDPLSPRLFIIAAEILSMYLARVHLDEGVPRFSQPACNTLNFHQLLKPIKA